MNIIEFVKDTEMVEKSLYKTAVIDDFLKKHSFGGTLSMYLTAKGNKKLAERVDL